MDSWMLFDNSRLTPHVIASEKGRVLDVMQSEWSQAVLRVVEDDEE
jgi:predicted ABC-type ATPase